MDKPLDLKKDLRAMRKALITGITGQDGSYLAEFLLSKGYQVYGIMRRTSTRNDERIRHLLDSIELIDADILDTFSLLKALRYSQPDEIYNLASMSYVETSFREPVATGEYTALSVTRMLDAIRIFDHPIRFYQASSSEMFGRITEPLQNENTPFYPRSPYAVAKLYGHWISVNYRESYGMYTSSGILFNHESPRRGHEFVTRKISFGVAQISLGVRDYIELGNLDAQRDWGFAGDYVEAMWMALQQDEPDDYVVATGKAHSVRDFIATAFKYIGIDEWERYIRINPKLFRPADVDFLLGDASKIRRKLGWKPRVSFDELVSIMVESDLRLVAEQTCKTVKR